MPELVGFGSLGVVYGFTVALWISISDGNIEYASEEEEEAGKLALRFNV